MNTLRNTNLQESLSLMVVILLLLVVPKTSTSIVADIGITSGQLEALLGTLLFLGLAWNSAAGITVLARAAVCVVEVLRARQAKRRHERVRRLVALPRLT